MNGHETTLFGWCIAAMVAVAGFATYFAPTIIATQRRQWPGVVFAANLLFGWTIIGWFGALIVALMPRDREQR